MNKVGKIIGIVIFGVYGFLHFTKADYDDNFFIIFFLYLILLGQKED